MTSIEPPHDKTNKMTERPAKTQISLGIRPVWLESSLCARWVAKDPSFLHADSEDSDQPGHPPSLMRVFAVRMKKARVLSYPLSAQRRLWSDWADAILLVLSRCGSYVKIWTGSDGKRNAFLEYQCKLVDFPPFKSPLKHINAKWAMIIIFISHALYREFCRNPHCLGKC